MLFSISSLLSFFSTGNLLIVGAIPTNGETVAKTEIINYFNVNVECQLKVPNYFNQHDKAPTGGLVNGIPIYCSGLAGDKCWNVQTNTIVATQTCNRHHYTSLVVHENGAEKVNKSNISIKMANLTFYLLLISCGSLVVMVVFTLQNLLMKMAVLLDLVCLGSFSIIVQHMSIKHMEL